MTIARISATNLSIVGGRFDTVKILQEMEKRPTIRFMSNFQVFDLSDQVTQSRGTHVFQLQEHCTLGTIAATLRQETGRRAYSLVEALQLCLLFSVANDPASVFGKSICMVMFLKDLPERGLFAGKTCRIEAYRLGMVTVITHCRLFANVRYGPGTIIVH